MVRARGKTWKEWQMSKIPQFALAALLGLAALAPAASASEFRFRFGHDGFYSSYSHCYWKRVKVRYIAWYDDYGNPYYKYHWKRVKYCSGGY
jgi:hypothetical protein